ncbi:MAG: hypothetical protein QNM02_02500 [Acidimicrobiia bacterium]|nr:hypothetical protein [Acidimicrobiia bacterium]
MLRACRRILRRDGRLAFLTIEPAPHLSERRRRQAHHWGPPAVAVPTSYASMLHTVGFSEIAVLDVTDEYRQTQQRWIDATDRREEEIRGLIGDEEYDDRQRTRADTVQAIDDGLLCRTLYSAAR